MHELLCPSCNTPSQYNFSDYLLMCPFCSTTFKVDLTTGQKEKFGDHYIVPNTIDSGMVKELAMEWLKRLHHKPGLAEREFFIVDIQGFSLPLWIISLEGHSTWKGLVQKKIKANQTIKSGADYLLESGQFRRSYRWAVSARANICETWGLTRLHEPKENVTVEWDGFPMDSTFSRGRLVDNEKEKSAYDIRNFFEFKFANGLPILGIQVSEAEALRRARAHLSLYHYKLSCINCDYLIDHRTELEIAGIQLIHVPMWKVGYIYQPKTALRHFYRPKERRIIMDGYGKGILTGELAIARNDKVTVNALICTFAALLFFILGGSWHPAFHFVGIFAMIIALISAYIALTEKAKKRQEEIKQLSSSLAVAPEPNHNTVYASDSI